MHVVVEEAPEPEPTTPGRDTQLLVLSARNPEALDAAAADLARHLRAHPDLDLADVANTLQVGREVFAHRRLIRCADRAEALAALDGDDPARVLGGTSRSPNGRSGSCWPGSASTTRAWPPSSTRRNRSSRAAIDECHAVLDPLLGLDLRELLCTTSTAPRRDRPARAARPRRAAREARDGDADDRLTRTAIAHPAVFVVEYALARLLMSWGVAPDSLAGYSVGEYVAATLAGVLSLPDALRAGGPPRPAHRRPAPRRDARGARARGPAAPAAGRARWTSPPSTRRGSACWRAPGRRWTGWRRACRTGGRAPHAGHRARLPLPMLEPAAEDADRLGARRTSRCRRPPAVRVQRDRHVDHRRSRPPIPRTGPGTCAAPCGSPTRSRGCWPNRTACSWSSVPGSRSARSSGTTRTAGPSGCR